MIGDHVVFSSRIQLLVSKLGRSSKPSPRFLVLVSRYHLVEANALLITV